MNLSLLMLPSKTIVLGLIFITACTSIDSPVAGETFKDNRCWQVQSEQRDVGGCGVLIPPLATMIEVNGLVLPLEDVGQLQNSAFPFLLLPKGTHWIQFRPDEKPVKVTIPEHFRVFYDRLRSHYGLPKSVDEDRILEACGDALDAYRQPFLLNIHGAYYAKQKKRPEAMRKWRRALRLNPTFGPAHLNLALALLAEGDTLAGERELNLAELFNVGDVYAIAEAIWNIRSQYNLHSKEENKTNLAIEDYLADGTLSIKDRRMVGMMKGISKYAVDPGERAKILNNLAAYLATTNKPEWACVFFREGLSELKANPNDYRRLAVEIIRHMREVCEESEMNSEAREYAKVILRLRN
jgi:tetratricopeptide (TPR) repeat protein